MTLRWPARFTVGLIHHATYLKQSPPIDGEDFRRFLRAEITAMRACGFTAFNLSASWADCEIDDGRWDFSRVDIAHACCAELGMPVFLWLFAEITPAWLGARYPQTAAIAASGYRSRSHSYADPLARERVAEFLRQCVTRYGRHERLLGYNVGVESGFQWMRGPDGTSHEGRLFDYNPAAIAGFRRFLRARYGTIAALNRIWRDHLPSFEAAEPPRARYFRDGPMLTNQAPWLDWRLATCAQVTEYIRFKAACVRALDPHVPISDQSYEVDPAQNGQDPWAIDEGMDVAGTSMFTSTVPGDYMTGNFLQDLHRSAGRGKPFWIWELRAGQNAWGLTNFGPMPTTNDIARFLWQVIAQGATCVQFWNWRPHLGGLEVGGHGFTRRDGTPTERARRIGAIARLLAGDPWYLQLQRTPAAVAFLESPTARILASGESSDRILLDATRGLYAAITSQGHRCDLLTEADLAAALPRYRVLCLPLAYALSAAAATAIAAWVEAGGTLVSGVLCGAKDEHGFGQERVPGHGLDRVFGGLEETIEPVFSPQDRPVSNFGEAWDPVVTGRPVFTVVAPIGPRCRTGHRITGARYRATLVPQGAQVVATDEQGRPAILFHRHGRGAALLIGACPVGEHDFASDGLASLLADTLALAGVQAPVEVRARGDRALEGKLLQGPGGGLVLALNASPEPQQVTLLVRGRRLAAAVEVEQGTAVPLAPDPEGTTLTLVLGPGDARAIRVTTAPEDA